MADPVRDPIPNLAREVIELYRDALSEVRFPDVDRARLDESERTVLEAQCAVEDAEAALEKARAELGDRSQVLAARVQRALSYARVFSEDDPALRERVEQIASARPQIERPGLAKERVDESAPVPKRRGRPRKTTGDGASLFAASSDGSSAEGSDFATSYGSSDGSDFAPSDGSDHEPVAIAS